MCCLDTIFSSALPPGIGALGFGRTLVVCPFAFVGEDLEVQGPGSVFKVACSVGVKG